MSLKNLFNVDPEKAYSTREIADMFGMEKQTIQKLIREKHLNAFRFGNLWRVKGVHLIDYINKSYKGDMNAI